MKTTYFLIQDRNFSNPLLEGKKEEIEQRAYETENIAVMKYNDNFYLEQSGINNWKLYHKSGVFCIEDEWNILMEIILIFENRDNNFTYKIVYNNESGEYEFEQKRDDYRREDDTIRKGMLRTPMKISLNRMSEYAEAYSKCIDNGLPISFRYPYEVLRDWDEYNAKCKRHMFTEHVLKEKEVYIKRDYRKHKIAGLRFVDRLGQLDTITTYYYEGGSNTGSCFYVGHEELYDLGLIPLEELELHRERKEKYLKETSKERLKCAIEKIVSTDAYKYLLGKKYESTSYIQKALNLLKAH